MAGDTKHVDSVFPEHTDRGQATLASYLLTAGTARDGEDAFDRAMQELRAEGGQFLSQEPVDLGD